MEALQVIETPRSEQVVADICGLDWTALSETDVIATAWAYYYFSIQFRENLLLACDFYPEDANLAKLKREECNTDNLSPYPDVAINGEKLDHDEFMRRLLALAPISEEARALYEEAGTRYLEKVRAMDPLTRALSIPSYEDGGLERLFRAMLTASHFENPLLNAFRFFLLEHIRFDSDPDQGHGHLSRHLPPDENVSGLWLVFKDLLLECVPQLH